MEITTLEQRTKELELHKKLLEIEEQRKEGLADIPARELSKNLRSNFLNKPKAFQ